VGKDGLMTAFSKKSFTTGKENLLFIFQAKTDLYALFGAGVAKNGR
jgi:hypothetical protein